MALPDRLRVALKEWAPVCSALETGRQIILLRKGGIHESGGEFEVENRQFVLFMTVSISIEYAQVSRSTISLRLPSLLMIDIQILLCL